MIEIVKKKHLILFSYDYPPSDGGIARLCHEITVGALVYYEKVIVLTRKKEGLNKPYNTSGEVAIVSVQSRRIACEIDCLKFLRSIKKKEDYDVLCGLWHPEATITLLSGFKNIYILAHGAELQSGTSIFRKYFWLPVYAHCILNNVKGVIANSHYTEKLAKRINPKVRTMTLPLAVNHLFFRPLTEKKNTNHIISICSVSRILRFKGHDFVLKTLATLPKNYQSKIRYNIAGTGAYLPMLKQLVKQLHLENIVSFRGYVADDNLPSFYNEHDLFILCTRESPDTTSVEGFGLVFLEAQSCGIPVIGARTGGIPDAVAEGNGGWLIEQDNTVELSSLLVKLTDNQILVTQMGEKARKRVENFCTWEIYCKKLFDRMRV
jgi:phosphatidylinositol alpha-1,6-mannosyltransferase